MKSVVMAFSQLQVALSSALNFALVAVNVEQKFVWLFGSFAVTAWIVGTIFFFTFWDLDRRESELSAKAIVKGFLEIKKQRLIGVYVI